MLTLKSRAVRVGLPLLLLAGAGAAVPAIHAYAAVANTQVWWENGALHFHATADAANQVTVTRLGAGFRIQDVAGGMSLDLSRAGGCTAFGWSRIDCPTRGPAVIELGAGADTYTDKEIAFTDADVFAGDGNDVVWVSSPGATRGGDGDDNLDGGVGRTELWGDNGNDSLDGGAGDDQIVGGDGNDKLYGEGGHDLLNGGPGVDTVNGGSGDDELNNPDKSKDSLYGGSGNDRIDSGATVSGGDGDDEIDMTAGFGDYHGDAGVDTIDYTLWPYSQAWVSLDGNNNDGDNPMDGCGNAVCGGQGRHNVHGDFEVVIGTSGADMLRGNGDADRLEGRGGNDILNGEGGDDILEAGPGANQTTNGGAGTDTCHGANITHMTGCDII
jgi:Ca2+-binding RTX toxin-like protein